MSLHHTRAPALALTGFAAMALIAGTARAQNTSKELVPGSWSATIGIGAVVAPEYPGSDEASISPVPLIDLRYRVGMTGLDTVFLNTGDGLGVVVLRRGAFSTGVSVNYASGRDEDDGDRLRGLGAIDAAARGRLFVRADFGALGLGLDIDRAFGAQDGTFLTMKASYSAHLTPALSLTGHVGATLADGSGQRQWFGVTEAGAARSGLPAYRPDGGLQSGTLGVTAAYALTPHWRLTARVGVTQLLGDAADSPVVENETQPYGFLGVSYRF
ncbi:MipA/OmpV family protein [Azospirillum halopraeferens]|uniref:MipA/OmpV family protein n=1 Tax=Azospirillum halopraeferens TaxID=34010 RepID=UPI000422B5FA|nr:MipA/OmpV family protein [Azospirillum halopraeferens]